MSLTHNELKLLYIGTAQLLVNTHNRLAAYSGVDAEQEEVMDHFMADFNEAGFSLKMSKGGKNSGTRYHIFDRSDEKEPAT